jgi:glycine/D-amino acid oxidase-like deaminating enzyme
VRVVLGKGSRVAVVGGGVLGVSTGVHLARGGAVVHLVTETGLASGASGRSLSWLNSSAAYTGSYHALRVLGIERYRDLAERRGQVSPAAAAYVRMDGGVRWAAEGAADGLRALHEHQRRVGYPSVWLMPDDVAGCVPGVDPAAVPADGAVLNAGEGWVDLPSLVSALARELVALGGRIVTDAGRTEVVVRDDRVAAVAMQGGQRADVDAAVLATGADVPRALRRIGVEVPDATSPALLVRTTEVATPLRAVLNTPRVSMRPTPDGCLVMDSGWSEREVETMDDGTYRVRPDTVRRLLDEASSVLAGHPRLAVASYGVGPKPLPGDGHPVLGPVAGISGYHVAFTHSGATLGLICGELLAQEVLTGEPSPLLDAFRLDRFRR